MPSTPRNFAVPRSTAFLVLLAIAVTSRAQTFGNPVLGFDEQFYVVMGDRWLHGAIPYVDVFDRKPIGLFLIYAAAQVFGGNFALEYQLVALGFATGTAYVTYRIAQHLGSNLAALTIAAVYLIWLIFMEGLGGQAQVFMNLFMAMAALAILKAHLGPNASLFRLGLAAMAAVGIAIQIKTTSIVEGAIFGLYLTWLAWRSTGKIINTARYAAIWATVALLPTLAAWAAYALAGHGDAWMFANIWSGFGKLPDAPELRNEGTMEIGIVALPLLVLAALGLFRVGFGSVAQRLCWGWLGAAVFGVLAFNDFLTPQYAMGALLPLVLVTTPVFEPPVCRWTIPLFVIVGMAFSQITVARLNYFKGGANAAYAVAAAATPRHGGCIYVYDGYPILYRMVHACTLSRYLFPGHLNMANEASARGLGVDPAQEVERIMRARPEVVVNETPAFIGGNRVTQAIVARHLAADYHLVLRYRTGVDRDRLVYRLNDRATE